MKYTRPPQCVCWCVFAGSPRCIIQPQRRRFISSLSLFIITNFFSPPFFSLRFPLYLLSATVSSSSFCRISIQRGVLPSPRSISTSFFLTFVSHFDLMFFISDSQRIELSDFFVRFSFRLSPAVLFPPVFFFHFRLFPFSFFLHLFSQFTGSPRFSVVQREAVEENNPNPAHSRGFRR